MLRDLDPQVPLFEVTTLEDAVVGARFTAAGGGALFAGVFGGLGFLFAAIGTYALMSYVASLRAREMVLRLALGATSRDVVRLFVTRGLQLAGLALVVGGPCAAFAIVAIQPVLGDVTGIDPLVLGGSALLLSLVVAVSGYLHGRQVAAAEPLVALRHD